jgi:molybdopterin-guanine dinucleotide biosynthesis protein B
MKAIGFCASCSNAGKTTLLLEVLKELTNRGIRTAVLKHGRHLDTDNLKDSERYAEANAAASLFVSPNGWILEAHPKEELKIDVAISMLAGISGCELILVEGYKNAQIFKIAVCRRDFSPELPCEERDLMAVVSDYPMDLSASLPQFRFEEVPKLCDFILNH